MDLRIHSLNCNKTLEIHTRWKFYGVLHLKIFFEVQEHKTLSAMMDSNTCVFIIMILIFLMSLFKMQRSQNIGKIFLILLKFSSLFFYSPSEFDDAHLFTWDKCITWKFTKNKQQWKNSSGVNLMFYCIHDSFIFG